MDWRWTSNRLGSSESRKHCFSTIQNEYCLERPLLAPYSRQGSVSCSQSLLWNGRIRQNWLWMQNRNLGNWPVTIQRLLEHFSRVAQEARAIGEKETYFREKHGHWTTNLSRCCFSRALSNGPLIGCLNLSQLGLLFTSSCLIFQVVNNSTFLCDLVDNLSLFDAPFHTWAMFQDAQMPF